MTTIQLEEAIAKIRTPEEAVTFMSALFSPHEIAAVQHRWQAFQMLLAGATQRNVATQLGMGVATASRAAAAVRTHRQIIRLLVNRARNPGSHQ